MPCSGLAGAVYSYEAGEDMLADRWAREKASTCCPYPIRPSLADAGAAARELAATTGLHDEARG